MNIKAFLSPGIVHSPHFRVAWPETQVRTAVLCLLLLVGLPGVQARICRERRLDEAVPSDGDLIKGHKVSDEEAKTIHELCLDQEHETVLLQVKGHFFFSALAPDSAPSECLSLGFTSCLGEKIMLKGEHGHIEPFHFDEGQRFFKLRDILTAFQKAEPTLGTGSVVEEDTCLHFGSRIWRELGIEETKALGDFIVANVLRDVPNDLLGEAVSEQMPVGLGVVARFAKRRIVEEIVFSSLRVDRRSRALAEEALTTEMSECGLQMGFDHRHLEGGCRDRIYNLDLLVIGNALIFAEPASEAQAAGCASFLLCTIMNEGLQKEVTQFDDGIPNHEELQQYHATIIGMEAKPLSTIVHAFYEASAYPLGHEGEDFDGDLIASNPGDFVANFFSLIGHTSSPEEVMIIAAGMIVSDPNLAENLRASSNDYSVCNMTDFELLEWVVEQRAEPMYNTTN